MSDRVVPRPNGLNICHWCHRERDTNWALLFSAPDENGMVRKMHICPDCLGTCVYASMNVRQTQEPSLLERMASALKNLTIYLHYGHDCGADCTMLCKDVLQGKAILAEYEQWRAGA